MLRRGGVRGLHRAATTPTAARLQPRAAVGARGLHQGTRVVRANAILEADQTNFGLSFYHKINNALLALTPVAMVLAPSSLCMPVDLALGVLFPLHSHIAMNFVITDYVPKITSSAGTCCLSSPLSDAAAAAHSQEPAHRGGGYLSCNLHGRRDNGCAGTHARVDGCDGGRPVPA